MLRSIVRFSLRFPWLVVAVAAGLVFIGFLQFSNARKDLLPEFTPTTVEVQTEALGLSAYEVEQLITVPLEQDLLNGVAFLDEIESASLPGLSSVVMIFEPGTDLLDARQVVAERLTQAVAVAGLPQVADAPQMIQPLSSTSRVAIVSLSSSELTPIEQSVQARWVIVPSLLGVDGVANVAIFGFRDRQLQVLADPERLAQEKLDLSDIIRTSGNALEVSPLSFLEASSPGTGGFIDTANQRFHIFHEQTISTPEELGQVPIEDDEGAAVLRNGTPLLLGDVTDIVEDHQPLIGDAQCQDGPCVLLVIEKFPEANTPAVAAGVEAALESLKPGLPGIDVDTSIYEPAAFVDTSLQNLGIALLIGAILLVAVVGLVFLEWRTALVAVVTLTASLGGAAVVLNLFDVTINTMILAGVAMALVVMIDDAVSTAGLIAKRAEQKRIASDGAPLRPTIMAAVVEMGRPALYATAIVVAVLVPFFVAGGVIGAFFQSIAFAYLVAVAVALLVTLMAAPALSVIVIRKSSEAGEPGLAHRIENSYAKRGQRRMGITAPMVTFGLLVLVGLIALPFLDSALRPSLQERDLVVSLEGPSGMSLGSMDEITGAVVDDLQAVSGVTNIAAHVGRAITSDQIVNVNSGEVWLSIDESADYDTTVDAVEGVVAGYSEVSADVSTYSDQRVTEVLGQSSDELIVRVYGEDDPTLASTAEGVRDVVAGVDGVGSATVLTGLEEDTIEIEVDLEKAQALGLKPGDIRRTAATLLAGITVGNLFEEQKVFDVVVWGLPELRQTPEDVGNLLVTTPTGSQVLLSEVADVRVVSSPTVIRHESVSKFIDVNVVSDNGDLSGVASAIEAELGGQQFPAEFHAAVLGGFADAEANRTTVISVSIAALIIVYLILQSAFTSWRLATLSILLLPAAFSGSIIATLVFSREFSLGVIAGLVAILGLASRWIVTLVKHYQDLERGGAEFGNEMVLTGTTERLIPILASGAAIFAFFLPGVIRSGVAGLEVVGPLAIAVAGGVLTTLVLALYVFPAAYAKWGYVKDPDRSSDDLFVDYSREEELV
ncbi:MAG: efflux RND transporter permease subunit [Actinomycetota bacterium]|nr:efflux RND transporter permease subunit [Actinomycetota bacterium]